MSCPFTKGANDNLKNDMILILMILMKETLRNIDNKSDQEFVMIVPKLSKLY